MFDDQISRTSPVTSPDGGTQAKSERREREVAQEFIELLSMVHSSILRRQQYLAPENESTPPRLSKESKARIQQSVLRASA